SHIYTSPDQPPRFPSFPTPSHDKNGITLFFIHNGPSSFWIRHGHAHPRPGRAQHQPLQDVRDARAQVAPQVAPLVPDAQVPDALVPDAPVPPEGRHPRGTRRRRRRPGIVRGPARGRPPRPPHRGQRAGGADAAVRLGARLPRRLPPGGRGPRAPPRPPRQGRLHRRRQVGLDRQEAHGHLQQPRPARRLPAPDRGPPRRPRRRRRPRHPRHDHLLRPHPRAAAAAPPPQPQVPARPAHRAHQHG
ncbi:hypothetical protein CTA2_2338, partial [Colletotrichum tanaceti]